jgi:hypothetical protein
MASNMAVFVPHGGVPSTPLMFILEISKHIFLTVSFARCLKKVYFLLTVWNGDLDDDETLAALYCSSQRIPPLHTAIV